MTKLNGPRKWVFLFLFFLLLAPWPLAAAEPPGRLGGQLSPIWTFFLQVWKGATGHDIDPWGQTNTRTSAGDGTPEVNSPDTGPQIDPWG
jgi:hypothetical protein